MANSRTLTQADTSEAVDAFMARLDHPYKALVEALRALILGCGPGVAEGVKWNAPSYRTHEYFATTNLRAKAGIGIILHLGAKVRATQVEIDDPAGLLTWHDANRASFVVSSVDDLHAHTPALRAILAQWLAYV